MTKNIFPSGLGVALVTPFNEDSSIDYPSLEKIIEHVIKGGVDYIVSLGTTGESATLTFKEEQAVISFTVEKVNSRIPIVAGCFGGYNTLALAEKLHRFDLTGVKAILSASPSYIKPTQEGIFQHYKELLNHSPIPIILYNVPSRTSSNIDASTCVRLANYSDKCIGVKEASGNMMQASQIVKNTPQHFQLVSGDDITALPFIACGGTGLISVIANAYPRAYKSMVDSSLHNDFHAARIPHEQLLDIHHWLYLEGNPAGIKGALNILGLCKKYVRLPLVPLTTNSYNSLKLAMDEASKPS